MGFRNSDSILTYNLHTERLEYELLIQQLTRSQRYKMFFSGLIFAVISFIGVNPLHTNYIFLKILEVTSSVSLLISGILLLIRLSETRYQSNTNSCNLKNFLGNLIFNSSLSYWCFFLIGIVLLIVDRAIIIFTYS